MVDTELERNSKNSAHSSLRESIIEYLFVGEILKALWLENTTKVEVLKPQVDDAGYDLVIECKRSSENNHSSIRHIQLKSSHAGAKTSKVSISEKLGQKPNWCVIWIFFDPKTLRLGPFFWFPQSGNSTPDMNKLKTTKHTKGTATGYKADRPGHHDVPKGKFDELKSIPDVIDKLFPNA